MKRHPGLQRLSREHHVALVLAKQAQRFEGETAEATRFMAEVAQAFAIELEPHFLAEESGLLAALDAAGQAVLAERTLAEHQTLRAVARRLAAGDTASLRRFGELLEAHIRFEERDLFPRAESILPPQALSVIDRAARTPSSGDLCRLADADPQCPPPVGKLPPTSS